MSYRTHLDVHRTRTVNSKNIASGSALVARLVCGAACVGSLACSAPSAAPGGAETGAEPIEEPSGAPAGIPASGASPLPEGAVQAPSNILYEARVQNQRFEFATVSLSGGEQISAIYSHVPAGEKSYLVALNERHGALTALEAFRALAPLAAPPAALLAAHEAQGLSFGRENGEVRTFSLDGLDVRLASRGTAPGGSVEKALPPNAQQQCRAAVFVNTDTILWSQVSLVTHSSPDEDLLFNVYQCVGGESDFVDDVDTEVCTETFDDPELRVAICNLDPESPSTLVHFPVARFGEQITWNGPQLVERNTNVSSTFFPEGFRIRAAIAHFPLEAPFATILASGVGVSP